MLNQLPQNRCFPSLPWRHDERNGVPNHRRLICLLNRVFRRRPKKTSKLRGTCFCEGNPLVTGGSLHKGPVTGRCFHLITPSCHQHLEVIAWRWSSDGPLFWATDHCLWETGHSIVFKRQAIFFFKDDKEDWCHMEPLGHNELNARKARAMILAYKPYCYIAQYFPVFQSFCGF